MLLELKIAGVTHEYMTLPGVHDSIIDILLNLKGLIVEKSDSGIEWISLSKKKGGIVTAADIKCPAGVTIHNPDLYITSLDTNFDFAAEIRIEKNVGYVSIEDLKHREDDTSVLLLDANFSPVVTVRYDVTDTRYGEMTNLDSLEMVIKTNGVMSPSDVVKFSGKMLESYFRTLQ